MGGLSRYDFFRMLLPGAIVVFLLDLGLRVLLVDGGTHARTLENALTVIERPLVAITVAFAVGLVLYFVDLAYTTPAFWKNIPSSHLSIRLAEADVATDHLSLFFRASDELMPEAMRERALLYGALYRAGFQAMLFSITAAVVLPVAVLLEMPVGDLSPGFHLHRADWWVTGGLVLAFVALAPMRAVLRRQRRDLPETGPVVFLFLALAPLLAMWLDLRWRFLPFVPHHRPQLVWLTTITLGVWWFLRVGGRPGSRLRYWRGDSGRPDDPYSASTNWTLDALAATAAVVGSGMLVPHMSVGQVLAINGSALVGLLLSVLGKHERQLQGIYRNQNNWIDAHVADICKLAGPATGTSENAPPPTPSSLVGKLLQKLSGTPPHTP